MLTLRGISKVSCKASIIFFMFTSLNPLKHLLHFSVFFCKPHACRSSRKKIEVLIGHHDHQLIVISVLANHRHEQLVTSYNSKNKLVKLHPNFRTGALKLHYIFC